MEKAIDFDMDTWPSSPAPQLTAGNAVSLSIQVQATHSHTVSLSAAEIVQIRGSTRVAKDSTSADGHTHTVTFN
jgi:hypothetical protein